MTDKAVVFCAPWGKEYLNSHRALRQLSLRLAAAGCHCLRFDWFGCGDSLGDATEGDVEGWAQDLRLAIDEVQSMSGVPRVFVVGLRLGSALAFDVALESPSVAGLVLWDPVIDGGAYVGELIEMDREFSRQNNTVPTGGEDYVDVLGFPLSEAQREQISRIDCSADRAGTKSILMIVSEERPEYTRFRDGLAGDYHFEVVPGPQAWVEQPEIWAGAIPAPQLERIEQWIASA